MSGHDRRCEQSRTPVQRCKCQCAGTKHGVAVVRQRLGFDQEETTHDQ